MAPKVPQSGVEIAGDGNFHPSLSTGDGASEEAGGGLHTAQQSEAMVEGFMTRAWSWAETEYRWKPLAHCEPPSSSNPDEGHSPAAGGPRPGQSQSQFPSRTQMAKEVKPKLTQGQTTVTETAEKQMDNAALMAQLCRQL